MDLPCRVRHFVLLWPLVASLAVFSVFDSRAQAETTDYSGAQAITALPCIIAQEGTYYLANNLNLPTNENAITINASNVTLDFNGHTLSQSYGQNINTCGVGINGANVSVINGNIQGYFWGVIIGGNSHNCRAENLCITGSTVVGVCCVANNALIRRCRIFDTGGSPIHNDYACGVQIVTGSGPSITGNRVLDCDISLSTTGVPWPARYAIASYNCTDTLAAGNRITGYDWGISYTNATGKYRDNLIASVGTPYSGGTDAGGNN